ELEHREHDRVVRLPVRWGDPIEELAAVVLERRAERRLRIEPVAGGWNATELVPALDVRRAGHEGGLGARVGYDLSAAHRAETACAANAPGKLRPAAPALFRRRAGRVVDVEKEGAPCGDRSNESRQSPRTLELQHRVLSGRGVTPRGLHEASERTS